LFCYNHFLISSLKNAVTLIFPSSNRDSRNLFFVPEHLNYANGNSFHTDMTHLQHPIFFQEDLYLLVVFAQHQTKTTTSMSAKGGVF
jgi:hypothetical protein